MDNQDIRFHQGLLEIDEEKEEVIDKCNLGTVKTVQ